MIDVHILSHPTQDRSVNLMQLLVKLRRSDEINVHVVKGIKGHIGRGRLRGFLEGTSEYVTFIDDDDDVDVAVLESCEAILDANPEVSGVHTAELIAHKGQTRIAKSSVEDGGILGLKDIHQMHHLVVIRRKAMNDYLYKLSAWPNYCEDSLYILMMMEGHKFMYTDQVGYTWNRDEATGACSMGLDVAPETKHLIGVLLSG